MRAAVIRRYRDAAVGAALGRLSELLNAAADKLGQLLDDGDPRVQLGAAKALLETAAKYREHVELADAMRELERRVVSD